MQAVDAKWNDDGSILAIAGSQSNIQQDKQINVVQFFNVFGEVSKLKILAVLIRVKFYNLSDKYKINVHIIKKFTQKKSNSV